MSRVLVKACLNGARRPGSVDSLPVTPAELAREAAAVVTAGAGAIHVHPRDTEGLETLEGAHVGAALAAIRDATPGTPVGVTTGAWIVAEAERRLALISSWETLPDFASVNFHEDGAAEVAALLLERGVGVEAGLWTAEAAEQLAESGLGSQCLRVLIEPREREPEAALATAEAIATVLDGAGIAAPRLLHGSRATAWPLVEAAIDRGMQTRIGLEDTDRLMDGRRAGNAGLVQAAVALAGRAGG